MNPHMDTQEISVPTANGEPVPAEQELLAQWGFTAKRLLPEKTYSATTWA